jgi:histidinol dehydrogenase
MIRTYQAADIDDKWLAARRAQVSDPEIEATVAAIIARVRREGDAALRHYTARFSGVELADLKVSEQELAAALPAVGGEFLAILEQAADNIRDFHRSQLRQDIELRRERGIVLGQRFTPIEKVGIYVPGGTAAYPSSVLMNAIPAALAGCRRIVMVTPPQKDGSVAPDILAAAKIAGVSEIYKLGGAQAIAALAFGTQNVPRVDKIVGPGNIYVATAKKQVFGTVAIDMVAGPSEILIIADEQANPAYLAADLLSQAEHDERAAAILICLSNQQAAAVEVELARQLPALPRQATARRALESQGAIIIADNLAQAISLANAIAPEHLELAVAQPFELLPGIENAGSIFLGAYTPEPLGDYWAGPNHVLPTGGLARCFGPLSVDDFIKRSSYIFYTEQALREAADSVIAFAEHEGLAAHANSIRLRRLRTEENK